VAMVRMRMIELPHPTTSIIGREYASRTAD